MKTKFLTLLSLTTLVFLFSLTYNAYNSSENLNDSSFSNSVASKSFNETGDMASASNLQFSYENFKDNGAAGKQNSTRCSTTCTTRCTGGCTASCTNTCTNRCAPSTPGRTRTLLH